ncbi:MAG: hypothetical protein GXY32_08355 [Ruminococcaceae bacterium]|nr:hypothetical protein [Oscillospiraceae bacterium]
MTVTYYEELMQAFGCTVIDRIALGAFEGLPYDIELEGKGEGKQNYLIRFGLEGDLRPARDALRKQHIPYLRWHIDADAANDPVLVGVFRPPSDFYVKAGLRDILHAAKAAIDEADLHPPQNCPLCGLAGCDSYAFLNDSTRPTHAACLQSRLLLPEQDSVPVQKKKGYVPTGILGALLGAFVGALPNFAFVLNQGKIYWALYAFIPILSALVYRLCRGKASRLISGLSVLLASLLATFALEQVFYWLAYSTAKGYYVPIATSMASYFATTSFTQAVSDMLFCLIALLVGFFASTVILRRYANSGTRQDRIVRGSTFVRSSAFPIKPPADDAAASATDTTAETPETTDKHTSLTNMDLPKGEGAPDISDDQTDP